MSKNKSSNGDKRGKPKKKKKVYKHEQKDRKKGKVDVKYQNIY